MTLIFFSGADRHDLWQGALGRAAPDLPFRLWDDPGDDSEVEFALVWKPPPGELARRFPNLKCIFSLGAGVDHILADPDLPQGVPVVRMVEPGLTRGMTEYVCLHVLRHHRQQPTLDAQQQRREWKAVFDEAQMTRTVGIMGLGVLGRDAARALAAIGFPLRGWSRNEKNVARMQTFHGPDGLTPFLAGTDILVCLLPHTSHTAGLLRAELFDRLPRGACLINAGRGELQVEDDILAALDSGQLAAATLDVFNREPLPRDSALWTHPHVTVTPHNASNTQPATGAVAVAENIARMRSGKKPLHTVDPSAEY